MTREGQCKRAMQNPCNVLERDAHQMATSSQGNFEKNFELLDLAKFAKKQSYPSRHLGLLQKSLAW